MEKKQVAVCVKEFSDEYDFTLNNKYEYAIMKPSELISSAFMDGIKENVYLIKDDLNYLRTFTKTTFVKYFEIV